MNTIKYDEADFEKLKKGELSVIDLANKYKVSVNAIHKAKHQRGIKLVKKRIKIISPYGVKVCESQTEVAEELKISPKMVGMILRGYDKCETVNQLQIKLEVLD